MGHRRRPKGPRSTWEPKLTLNADRAALPAAPPRTDTAIPDAAVSVALENRVLEPGAASGRGAAAPDVLPDAGLPLAALIPPLTAPPVAPVAPEDTARDGRVAAASDGLGLVAIGSTIARYMQDEGEAAVAHMRALSGAGSPAELMRLQMDEVRRAADASLTCWGDLARTASRLVAFR